MITSFPTLRNNDNIGGTLKFFFIPVEDLVSSPDIFNNTAINAHELVAEKSWLTGYFDKQSGKLDIGDSTSAKGQLTKTAFKGNVSNSSREIDLLFCEMRCHRFVLIVIDNNFAQRIVGTKESGCTFKFDFSSRLKYSELPGYEFSFEHESGCIPPHTGEITDIC